MSRPKTQLRPGRILKVDVLFCFTDNVSLARIPMGSGQLSMDDGNTTAGSDMLLQYGQKCETETFNTFFFRVAIFLRIRKVSHIIELLMVGRLLREGTTSRIRTRYLLVHRRS